MEFMLLYKIRVTSASIPEGKGVKGWVFKVQERIWLPFHHFLILFSEVASEITLVS